MKAGLQGFGKPAAMQAGEMDQKIFIYYDDTKRWEPIHVVPMTPAKIRRFAFRVNPLPAKSQKKIVHLGQTTSGWVAQAMRVAQRCGAIDEFDRLAISLSRLDKQLLARCVGGVEVRNSRGRLVGLCPGRHSDRSAEPRYLPK
jgi:hypothetical protein